MLKRFIFWEYPRASWQYDVMVGLILAFIFLTPRTWFRDQPRTSSIAILHSGSVVMVEPELLAGVPEAERVSKLRVILRGRRELRHVEINRVEPVYDSENEIKAYIAVVQP